MQTVLHGPRVAWDGAVSLTRAARADEAIYGWCRDWIADLLGPMLASAFVATRRRLLDPAAAATEELVQLGQWRVRLDDTLRRRPDIAGDLDARIAETRTRVRIT